MGGTDQVDGASMIPGEFNVGPFVRFGGWLRRNLLLMIFLALLVMQVMIWLKLDLIERSIPYGSEGPRCDASEPCHVIIDRAIR